MEDISLEIKEKVHQVCLDYLGGSWALIKLEDIIIEKLVGGFVNLILKLSLPASYAPLKDEPAQVVIKFSKELLKEGYFRQMTENIIAVVLAENNLAPKVYGIFDGGRIDEYVKSRLLIPKDLQDANILRAIGQKLARLHTVTLPINKNPDQMFNKAKALSKLALDNCKTFIPETSNKNTIDKFLSINHQQELEFMQEIIGSVNSPVVYCHGDLQLNNILLREDSPSDPIHIVDYDLSGYNYRGHDIANLFNSYCFDLLNPEPPHFRIDYSLFPSIHEQRCFVKIYLEEFQMINNLKLNLEKEESHLLKEFKIFHMLYVYFIVVLALSRVTTENQKSIFVIEILLERYCDVRKQWFSPN